MSNEKLYQVSLNLIPRIGNLLIKQLISYCGSARAIFETSKRNLTKIPGIGPVHANLIYHFNQFNQAEQIILSAAKQNITLLFYTEKDYPNNLKEIYDAPCIIYVKGSPDLNREKIVSIVGTRQATKYGKLVTQQIVRELKKYNPLIVSGLAYGIDIQAHRAAIQSGLPTLAVLASGLNHIYPHYHQRTVEEMLQLQGGIMSEYPVGKLPDPGNFPARNRIIAGIAHLTIVVEAAEKGGALITANLADGYHREVFAVPGNINNQYSQGCNTLIAQHKAAIYTGIEALETRMNWDLAPKDKHIKTRNLQLTCNEEELKLVDILSKNHEGLHIDTISFKSQFPVHKVANILLQLEFKGIINGMPGKKFKLT